MSKPNSRFQDIAGQTFGHMKALRFVGYGTHSKQLWEFECMLCGSVKSKVQNDVVNAARKGRSPSCGCRQFSGNRRTHGLHGTHEYSVWKAMRQRCNDAGANNYHNYGGRGISVCARWGDFTAFLADMGPAPTIKHTIERKENDGNYEPDNCRWATRAEQSRNTRQNIHITYRGRTMCLKDWAKELNIKYITLHNRLRTGWPVHEAFTLPVGVRNWKSRPF